MPDFVTLRALWSCLQQQTPDRTTYKPPELIKRDETTQKTAHNISTEEKLFSNLDIINFARHIWTGPTPTTSTIMMGVYVTKGLRPHYNSWELTSWVTKTIIHNSKIQKAWAECYFAQNTYAASDTRRQIVFCLLTYVYSRVYALYTVRILWPKRNIYIRTTVLKTH